MQFSNIYVNIADQVEVVFDTWIVGDQFLKEYHSSLKALKSQAKKKKEEHRTPPPYLMQFYNLKVYYKSSVTAETKAATRIFNSLLDAVNENKYHLPKFIIVVIDKEIVEDYAEKPYSVAEKFIQEAIEWLTENIKNSVLHKHDALIEKCAGAVCDEMPSIIYTRMLTRIGKFEVDSKPDRLYSLTPMFNFALNNTVAKRNNNIMTIMSCKLEEHFDRRGNLTPLGANEFWIEVNDLMHRHDLDKVKLVPNQRAQNQKRIQFDRRSSQFPHRDRYNYHSHNQHRGSFTVRYNNERGEPRRVMSHHHERDNHRDHSSYSEVDSYRTANASYH